MFGLFIVDYEGFQKHPIILKLLKIIPIDENCKLQIDLPEYRIDGDISIKVVYFSTKLIFELHPGPKTDVFINKLKKACTGLDYCQDFKWLEKYMNMAGRFTPDNAPQGAYTIYDPLKTGSMSSLDSVKSLSAALDDTNTNGNKGKLTKSQSGDGPFDSSNSIPRSSIAVGATHLAARESIVWCQMNSRYLEYTFMNDFRIFIGTWNVNGQPPTASLASWLACDPEPPDLYAVGFQELDLSKEAFVFNDSPREAEWLHAVKNGLHPAEEYKLVKLVRLVGMMLVVFVQKQHYEHVSGVLAETVGTGIMGKLGNKGGVVVRLDFHSTSMCFVNSHLAAHPEEVERRNQDYMDICSRISFQSMTSPKAIKDHDQIFWLGDLNYRINKLESAELQNLLEQNCFSEIFKYDQLKRQQELKKAFIGYEEESITFQPTYKYDLGSDIWSASRTPAWCDRILWRGSDMRQLLYRSHVSLKISDHKPVSAIFMSGVKVIDNTKHRKVYEDVMKQLDKLENEFLPQVTVDNLDVHFNVVKFIEPQRRYLIIANTGQVPVKFEFINKPKEASYCKEWLSIKPHCAFIMPGDKCDVELELYVDKRTVSGLNRHTDQINDILVLHLEGGKDFFVTVSGTYQTTCFGVSLDALVYIHRPISELSRNELVNLDSDIKKGNVEQSFGEPYDIPKEIWLLVDHLSRYGMDQDQLFEQPGLPNEIILIRECLDSCMPTIIPGSIHSIAETLLIFLESLPEPVIPSNFYSRCLEAAQNSFQCQRIIQQLPLVNQNVFRYLMAFLKALLYHSDNNKLDPKNLATLFGGILLRSPSDQHSSQLKRNIQTIERKKANFIYHFLEDQLS
ncbi:hypothetical protein CHUAL_007816 [Chamberlinius hualienensis]